MLFCSLHGAWISIFICAWSHVLVEEGSGVKRHIDFKHGAEFNAMTTVTTGMLTYGKPMVLIWFIKPYVWCTVKHMVQERHTSQNIWCKRRTYGAPTVQEQKIYGAG